jgi:hypothetical protein
VGFLRIVAGYAPGGGCGRFVATEPTTPAGCRTDDMAQRAATIAVIALVAVLWAAAPAQAAAPRLVMVSGAPLAKPVLLSDWGEITTLYGMLFNGPAALSELRGGRPSLQLALFWDANVWEPYVRDGRLGSLRPEQADQFGRFYPAVPDGPALVELPG